MPTYLLTWNPEKWPWDYFERSLMDVNSTGYSDDHWSTGNRTHVEVGAPVFLLKQGPGPCGLIAAGHVTSPSFKAPHWDPARAERGEMANYANVRFETIMATPKVTLEDLEALPCESKFWHPQASGTKLPADVANRVARIWREQVSLESASPEAETKLQSRYLEGLRKDVARTAIERSAGARAECLLRHGLACACCGVLLAERYGAIAEGFIHVHHLNPISDAGGQHTVDPRKDLVPVCPNCHAIMHLKNPPLTPEEMRKLLGAQ